MDKPHSLKKCLFMNAYHADQINYIKIQLHGNQMKKICKRLSTHVFYVHVQIMNTCIRTYII